MDYFTGVSLADLARKHPLSIGTAVTLVKALAETIQFAHQRGPRKIEIVTPDLGDSVGKAGMSRESGTDLN